MGHKCFISFKKEDEAYKKANNIPPSFAPDTIQRKAFEDEFIRKCGM